MLRTVATNRIIWTPRGTGAVEFSRWCQTLTTFHRCVATAFVRYPRRLSAICRSAAHSISKGQCRIAVGPIVLGARDRNEEVPMSYVDGFVVPVPRDKIEAYKAQARTA